MNRDIRISFVGDSFVQGVGDPEYRGWVGRVLQSTAGGPEPAPTGFNLGIRRNTSEDVRRRLGRELAPRLVPGADNRLVVSFGSNDMVEEEGRLRVEADRTLENLDAVLEEAARLRAAALVVGPPPVIDAGEPHLLRTRALAERMAALCEKRGLPFVPTTDALAEDPAWRTEALAGDGAHPASGGYRRLAGIVLSSGWARWLATGDRA
ncbi:GDSL-type esterase/lipase family protein [Phaeacidiphilus oryzae]|uniref:GDSL-type esterase/lipase family protein n=1 Tax=Phaeacidiphilus oryzae TaxID=348818 RepID=UPI0005607EED|nr:GDSL-type esterase/lipase family protein [Phaeacidiphilus oryzae]